MSRQHPYTPKCRCQRCKAVKRLVDNKPVARKRIKPEPKSVEVGRFEERPDGVYLVFK